MYETQAPRGAGFQDRVRDWPGYWPGAEVRTAQGDRETSPPAGSPRRSRRLPSARWTEGRI